MRDSWLYLTCLAHDAKADDPLPADILDRVPLGPADGSPVEFTTELIATFYAAHPHCRVGAVRGQPPSLDPNDSRECPGTFGTRPTASQPESPQE